MPITNRTVKVPEKYETNPIMEQLSASDVPKINVWDREISGFQLTKAWLQKNHKKVADYIDAKYTNLNSKKDHMRVLLKCCDFAGLPQLNKHYFENWKKINDAQQQQAGEQQISDKRKENFVSHQELCERREVWRKKFEDDEDDDQANQFFLFMSLVTLQPPTRGEIFNCKIWKNKKRPPPSGTIDNYVFRKAGSDTWWIRINHDKRTNIEKKKAEDDEDADEWKPHDFEFDSELAQKISPYDLTLSEILDKSLEEFPRDYLLSTRDGDTPIAEGFRRFEKTIFGHGVGVDLYRISYVNHYSHSKDFELNTNELKEVARLMRHSFITAQAEYKKLRSELAQAPSNQKITIKLTHKTPDGQTVEGVGNFKPTDINYTLRDYLQSPEGREYMKDLLLTIDPEVQAAKPFNLTEWSKEYRKTAKGKEVTQKAEKKYLDTDDHRRTHYIKKILKNINSGRTKTLSPASIENYQLYRDTEDTPWKSRLLV